MLQHKKSRSQAAAQKAEQTSELPLCPDATAADKACKQVPKGQKGTARQREPGLSTAVAQAAAVKAALIVPKRTTRSQAARA